MPYRIDGGSFAYLLVSSSSGRRWIFPKGVVDPGATAAETAESEAFEEAGARGALSAAAVCTYPRRKWGEEWDVEVYTLECEEAAERWPESHRRRRWATYEEARVLLSRNLRRVLRRIQEQLEISAGRHGSNGSAGSAAGDEVMS